MLDPQALPSPGEERARKACSRSDNSEYGLGHIKKATALNSGVSFPETSKSYFQAFITWLLKEKLLKTREDGLEEEN